MRNSNQQTLKEVLDLYVKSQLNTSKYLQAKIVTLWDELFGRVVAKYTTGLYVKKSTLFVTIESAVIKTELSYKRKEIIEKINEALEQKAITEIIFK